MINVNAMQAFLRSAEGRKRMQVLAQEEIAQKKAVDAFPSYETYYNGILVSLAVGQGASFSARRVEDGKQKVRKVSGPTLSKYV